MSTAARANEIARRRRRMRQVRVKAGRLTAAFLDAVPFWRCAYCRRWRLVHATFGLTFHATGARKVVPVCHACAPAALDEFIAAAGR